MPIVINKKGDVLLDFMPLRDESRLVSPEFRPLTHAVVVLGYEGKVVLVHDRFRDQWELPGGKIEPGESPCQCAVRELKEETGQTARDLRLAAVIRLRPVSKDHDVFGAIFIGEISGRTPFSGNEEISAISYWDRKSDIGFIDEIDRKLVELALRAENNGHNQASRKRG
jgi:8-oxo-dGTP diphosphatase